MSVHVTIPTPPPLAVAVSSFSGLNLKINVRKMSLSTARFRKKSSHRRWPTVKTRNADSVKLAPPVCLSVPLPVEDHRLIPFFRAIGSLMEWQAGLISDADVCKALRKAAAEVQRGGF